MSQNQNTNAISKKIDEAYDALLKVGEGKKLTDEQSKKISSVLEENLPEDAKLMRDIQSGNIKVGIVGNPTSITADVEIDPMTGKAMKIDIPDENKFVTDLDDILDNGGMIGKVEDTEVKYSETTIASALKNVYGTQIPDIEVSTLTALMIKASKGYKVKYGELPPSIKTKIALAIVKENNSIYTGNFELKNQMAEIFIDALAQEVLQEEINEIFVDLQDTINNIAKEGMSDAYNKSFKSQRNILEMDILKIASEIEEENPEKADILRQMHHAHGQSYSLDEMLHVFLNTGKCRVKKYDLEKTSRVYADFNRKYEKSKWIVRDISMLEPVLARKLSEKFSINDIRAFLIVFCKYTMNMNPDENIADHVFMYYFIMNILNLDAFDPDDEDDMKFYTCLIETIENFIIKIKEKAKI